MRRTYLCRNEFLTIIIYPRTTVFIFNSKYKMLPSRTPIYFPPTTRRPTINTIKPTTRNPTINTVKPTTGNPTGDSVLSSFNPSFRPSIVPVGLLTGPPSVQTTVEPTQVDRIGSYSIVKNSEEFIPVKFQYAVVSLSGCFLIALILFCCLFFKKKRKQDENTRIVHIFQPSQIQETTNPVSSQDPPVEQQQIIEIEERLQPPPRPPPRPQLVKSHSLPMPPSRLPPQPPPRRTMSYYKG